MPWPTDPASEFFGRGLWGWATSVWERITSDGSGSLNVHIKSQTGTQLIQQVMPTLLKPGIHGYDGAAWQELSLLWGYTERVAEQKLHTLTVGTTYPMLFTAVPAGYVDRITGYSLSSDKTGASALPYASFGGTLMVINPAQAVTANVYKAVSPFDLVLKAADFVQFNWSGLVVGDLIVVNIWGYRMAVG